MALEDVEALAITRKYMENVIFAKYSEYEGEIKSSSFAYYKQVIEKPLEDFRQKKIEEMKSKKSERVFNVEIYNQEIIPNIDKSMYMNKHTVKSAKITKEQLNLNDVKVLLNNEQSNMDIDLATNEWKDMI